MPAKPKAYEGHEPYLFVSYAHRDSDQVFPVLNELQERGYRFWYDDGIAPGSEWPEDIARHLDAAAAVVAFVTPRSMDSNNCRREINFSLSRNKPFLSILLEKTEMSLGMEMQLSAQQSILRYNYASWDDFIAKILACPAIVPCKGAEPAPEPEPEAATEAVATTAVAPAVTAPAPEPVAAPSPEPAPVTPAVALDEVPQDAPEAAGATEPQAATEQVSATAPQTVPTPALEAAPEDAQPKKRVFKTKRDGTGAKQRAQKSEEQANGGTRKKLPIAAIAACVVLVLGAIIAITTMTGSFKTSWGDTIKKNSTGVSASSKQVEQEDLKQIAAMKELRTLDLSDCDLSGCDLSAVTFAGTQSYDLDLSGVQGITDFSFLKNLTLSRLDVSGCSAFDDAALAAIDVTNLKQLDVSATGVTDLAPLADAPLKKLGFADTTVSDLTPLSAQQDLREIDGSRSKVASLDTLAELPSLTTMSFDDCGISKIAKSFASLRMRKVNLARTGVRDLSGFSNFTTLERLNLSGNPKLSSMDWLDPQNYETIKSVDLSETGFAEDGLDWLKECAAVEELGLSGVSLSSLAIAENMSNLKTLYAMNCGLEDISQLEACPNLDTIYLGCNAIDDVSGLAGLTSNSRVTLDLTHNKLETVEQLPARDYRAIMLYGNADNVASTLAEGVSSYEVVTPYFDGITDAGLSDVTTMLYVVDCPQNKVVKLEEALGTIMHLVSEDELWELYATDSFSYSLGDMTYLVNAVAAADSTDTQGLAPLQSTQVDLDVPAFDVQTPQL